MKMVVLVLAIATLWECGQLWVGSGRDISSRSINKGPVPFSYRILYLKTRQTCYPANAALHADPQIPLDFKILIPFHVPLAIGNPSLTHSFFYFCPKTAVRAYNVPRGKSNREYQKDTGSPLPWIGIVLEVQGRLWGLYESGPCTRFPRCNLPLQRTGVGTKRPQNFVAKQGWGRWSNLWGVKSDEVTEHFKTTLLHKIPGSFIIQVPL